MPLAGGEAREAVSPDEPATNARVPVVVEEYGGAKRPWAGALVDKSTTFQGERGEWSKPEAFLYV